MSRFTQTRARRALRVADPTVTRALERQAIRRHRPTGGGVFFRAKPRGADVPEVEQIRGIFRRVLGGTALGKRLGYDDTEPPKAA